MPSSDPTPQPAPPRWSPSPNLLGLSRVLVPAAVIAALAMVMLERPVLFTLLCVAEAARDTLPAALLALAMLGAGYAVLPRAAASAAGPGLRFALCLGGGATLFSCALLAAGLAGALSQGVVLGLACAGITAGAVARVRRAGWTPPWRRRGAEGDDAPAARHSPTRAESAIGTAAGLVAAAALFMLAAAAFTPPLLYDVTEYHLGALTDYWRAAGGGHGGGTARFVPVAHNFYARFPFPVESLFFAAVQLWPGHETGPKLLNALFVAACALLLNGWMRGRGTPAWLRRCGVVVFLGHASTLEVCVDAYIDAPVALLLVGAVAAFLRAEGGDAPDGRTRPPEPALLLPAMLMFGGALAAKYTVAQIFLLPVGALVALPALVRVWRGGGRGAVAGAVALGLLAPAAWLGKNVWFYGNPLEPFFVWLFRPSDAAALLRERVYIDAHFPRSPLSGDYWRGLPLRLGALGWHVLAPLAGLLLVAARRGNLRLAAVVAGSVLLWNLVGESQNRFLLPSVMLCIVLGADVLAAVRPRGLAAALAALALVSPVGSLTGHAVKLDFSGVFAWVAGYPRPGASREPMPPEERRTAYLAHNLGGIGEMAAFVNSRLPAGARVLLVYEARPWLFHRDVVYNTVFDAPEILRLADGAATADAVADRLRAAGVTHVLVNEAELRRFLEQYATRELAAMGIRNVAAEYDRVPVPEDHYLPFRHDPRWKALRGPVLEFLRRAGAVPLHRTGPDHARVWIAGVPAAP